MWVVVQVLRKEGKGRQEVVGQLEEFNLEFNWVSRGVAVIGGAVKGKVYVLQSRVR